jgi:hypothetical protein
MVLSVVSWGAMVKKLKPEEVTGVSIPVTCGLVMPISAIDGCTEEHWSDVKSIITDAIEGIQEPKFSVKLVSDADDVGVIQKRIVQNLYSSDIVVCDVSGKNSNVMFELGMRLAFDKPTIVVKDDKTDYSFDTGVIEHVGYPRGLRFGHIVTFKAVLADKVRSTYKTAKSDPDHSTFLKSFGQFNVASLNEQTVSADKVIVDMLNDLQSEVHQLRRGGLGGKASGDGLASILDAIRRHISGNPEVSLREVAQDSDFMRTIERDCDAPRYFNHRREFEDSFRRAVDILSDLRANDVRGDSLAPRQKRSPARRR